MQKPNDKVVVVKAVSLRNRIDDIGRFYIEAEGAAKQIDGLVNRYNLREFLRADHIGYKCDSSESFENNRWFLEPHAEYLYQSYISGRRIAIMKLKKAIPSILGTINFLELSDLKSGSQVVGGFDHMEAYPVLSYDDTISDMVDKGIEIRKVERPHHTTHDIVVDNAFILRLTQEALIEKIKRTEMK